MIPEGYSHQMCEVETPQDPSAPDLNFTSQGSGDCKAIVSGLLGGKAVKWEVVFDIEPYLKGREREEKVHEELWNETFHHLAGSSIIQDFERMADRECEIEHGETRALGCFETTFRPTCCLSVSCPLFIVALCSLTL